MKNQTLFNRAWNGVLKKNKKWKCGEDGSCYYFRDGDSCAIGRCLTVTAAKKLEIGVGYSGGCVMENPIWDFIVKEIGDSDRILAKKIQNCHDLSYTKREFISSMKKLAKEYELKVPT